MNTNKINGLQLSIFFAILLVVCMIIILLSSQGKQNVKLAQSQSEIKGITVTAQGKSHIVPDKGTFNINVISRGDSSKTVKDAQATKVKAVLDALKDAGVPEKKLQTESVNIYEDWSVDTEPRPYVGNTCIVVNEVDIAEAGHLMDVAIDAGATEVSSLEYATTEYDKMYADALQNAMDKAKEKALVLADAGDVTLGTPIAVEEGYEDTSYLNTRNYAMNADGASAEKTSIEPGEVDIKAMVTVTYDIVR